MERGLVPWRDKFDFVVSLACTACVSRLPSFELELARVGLRPDIRTWSVSNDCVEQAALRYMHCRPLVRKASYSSSTFNHYRAIRAAYELGASRVLLVEDDVRFLSDLDKLSATVAATPEDDVVTFDLLSDGAPSPSVAEIRGHLNQTAHDGWAEPQPHPCSMACIGLTRAGMEMFIDVLCRAFSGTGVFDVIDGYLADRTRRTYGASVKVAWPLAAIQRSFPDTPSNTIRAFAAGQTERWYADLGVNVNEYGKRYENSMA